MTEGRYPFIAVCKLSDFLLQRVWLSRTNPIRYGRLNMFENIASVKFRPLTELHREETSFIISNTMVFKNIVIKSPANRGGL